MGMVAASRVFAILETEDHIEDKGTKEVDAIQGVIDFEAVKFSYDNEKQVLKGVDFRVNQGSCVAIVGSTGAGKSTIINLLNRFYDIKEGSIKVDSVDVRDYSLECLRRHIAVVLQDVFLFADTIANNISLGNPNVSRESIVQAAKDIGVHEFIEQLPGGYDFRVTERGSTMSSGQRQLIAFLRAYVSNPSILVLDEATSSVDTYAEQLIQRATERITEGRTSIIIAHRLATVQKADRIIVLDEGRVVEEGTHEELLKRKGAYNELYKAQFLEVVDQSA